MTFEIASALTGATAALNLIKAGIKARDDARVQAALTDMADRLTAATMAALEMSQRMRALDAQIADLAAQLRDAEQRQAQRERYVLRQIRPGLFVRSAKASDDGLTPAHDVCQACFGDSGKVISVLQASPNGSVLRCFINAAHNLRIADDPPGAHSDARSPFDDT